MSDDPLFRGLELPAPPVRLREDALAAAHAALTVPLRADVWVRLLASRAARVAWAASVAVLAAANVLLPRTRDARESHAQAAPPRPDPEIAAITRLPRIDQQALSTSEGGHS